MDFGTDYDLRPARFAASIAALAHIGFCPENACDLWPASSGRLGMALQSTTVPSPERRAVEGC
jgi:hypothetical protein